MRHKLNQRNSLIGPVEGKTENCRPPASKNAQNSTSNPFGGPVRRLIGITAFVIALAMAVCDRPAPAGGRNGAQRAVQKADIIDDIIEIINDIINPPMNPRPEPDPNP